MVLGELWLFSRAARLGAPRRKSSQELEGLPSLLLGKSVPPSSMVPYLRWEELL